MNNFLTIARRVQIILFLLALSLMPGVATSISCAQAAAQVITIDETLEAATGYLRIHTQITQSGKVLDAAPAQSLLDQHGLGDLLEAYGVGGSQTSGGRSTSFMAFLDTGASAVVFSKDTAERFNLQQEQGAVYHEFGLHGESPMMVSKPYGLSIAGASGTVADGTSAPSIDRFMAAGRAVRFQVNPAETDPMVAMMFGAVDVVGMPAINKFIVEIDPEPLVRTAKLTSQLGNLDTSNLDQLLKAASNAGTGPAITLHSPRKKMPVPDVIIPLKATDFSRHTNAADKGANPSLAKNPVVENVRLTHQGKSTTGDFLLDTGSPVSMISTHLATQIGLLDANGNPNQAAAYQIPLSGIGGGKTMVDGYKINELRVNAMQGKTIAYRNVYVLVHDIHYQLDDGEPRTLEGLFGLNLLLPSAAGISTGMPSVVSDGPFKKIWINGPRSALGLDLKQ